jgi:tRNA A58 N-methylase Trm61
MQLEGPLMLPIMRTIFIAILLLNGTGLQEDKSHTPDVVYVGTPYDVVSKMLKLADVKKEDVVYDLGCGDGRMLVLAAKKYGCRGRGYEIDPERISAARDNVKKNGVGQLVTIAREDLFTLYFSHADVLSLYLLPEINKRLVPQFEKLKPGSRLVFHDYDIESYEADKTIRVTSNEDNASHTLYLYITPLKPAK